MELNNITVILQKELRDSTRNRWFLLYTLVFGFLTLSLVWLALSGAGAYRIVGFARTGAGLINLVILIVPLMGLTLGAMSIVGEKERGTFRYMLSHPISENEILLGKYIGLGLSMTGALALGFGCSGLFIAIKGGTAQVANFLFFVGLTFALSLICLSIGFLISTLCTKSATGIGLAVFSWLALVIFTDLGLMGSALVLKINVHELLFASLINPLQVFKLAAILVLRGSLDVLGPGGIYAVHTIGNLLLPILLTIMALMVGLPLGLSSLMLRKRRDP